MEIKFKGVALEMREDRDHEFLMDTRSVSDGYNVSESTIRGHKSNHKSELVEGKHYISVRNTDSTGSQDVTYWTKRGIVRLGFYIRTKRAKLFRDWVEDLIIKVEQQPQQSFSLPKTYREALEELLEKAKREEMLISENTLQGLKLLKQEEQINTLAPLAIVAQKLEFEEGSVPIGTFAHVIGFGQNQLFEQLRKDKILISKGERHNQPYADYSHWFEVKPHQVQKEGPSLGKIYWKTKITVKGQAALIKKYANLTELKTIAKNQLSIGSPESLN